MEKGMQTDPGSQEFAGGLNLVICKTSNMKQESQVMTYAAGPVKSKVDYITVWQEDEARVRNAKVNPNENVYHSINC